MITMKQARRMAPATPTERELEDGFRYLLHKGKVVMRNALPVRLQVYSILNTKRLDIPFRTWARKEFARRRDLSPKLYRIVHGG